MRVRLGVTVLLLAGASQAGAQGQLLQRLIEKGRHPAMRWGRFSDVQAEARALYLKNNWAPLWLLEGRPTAAARALLDALTTAGDRGLHAGDYDAAQLTALGVMLDRGGADQEQAVRFDAALTIGALRFVIALARGRVGPREAGVRLGSASQFDPAALVDQLRNTTAPGPVLSALEPAWTHYQLLKRALARYRGLARDTALPRLTWPGRYGVSEGARYPGAALLRWLLAALGDLAPREAEPRAGDSLFTAELAEGLRRFQVRSGEHVDGRLTEANWRALTARFAARIRQMELALERWRWLPRGLEGAPLFVSLPAGRLHYTIPPDDAVQVHMRVRTGSAFPRDQTVLAGMLTQVAFDPLKPTSDPIGHIRFLPEGETGFLLHGATLDDAGAPPPGREDPSYLRVVDAEFLAQVLLHERPGQTRAGRGDINRVLVRLPRSVPVLVVYGTAVARENGQVFFYSDSWGEDRRLERQLSAGYPYARAGGRWQVVDRW